MNKLGDMSVKVYYCPVCKAEEKVSTNHCGEIYSPCRVCRNTVQYCREAELGEPSSERRIVFYDFNISTEEGKENYKYLIRRLKDKGYSKFKVQLTWIAKEALREHDEETIQLYREHQFEGQYVSNIGRVHDWMEFAVLNRDIKAGYYLEKI